MRLDMRIQQTLALLLIASMIGCGKSGVQRLDLSGAITHNGKPVPAGQIRFEPNASKGGSGPAGYTSIVDGRFDTSSEDKGPVPGPVRIKVTGYVSSKAFAPAMFPTYTYEVDIVESSRSFDIDVPAASK